MTDWATEALSAYENLKEDGFEIQVRVEGSEGVFDPTTMAYTGSTPDTDFTTYAIKKAYSIRDINGTTIQTGDTRLIFAAYGADAAGSPLALSLTSANKILIGGVEQNVVSISPIDPGNVPLLYEAQVRK